MIDGPFECISTDLIDDTKIAELHRLQMFPGNGSAVLTFSLDKVQLSGSEYLVTGASITKESGTQRRLLMLSVSVPSHDQLQPTPPSRDSGMG